MLILGLTGSIGMGKSTASRMFRRLGVPVHDADAAVHRLLGKGGEAVAEVGRLFPGVTDAGAVDRRALGARVFGRPDELRKLERLLHPLVHRAEKKFLARARAERQRLAVLDIPLLFESSGQRRCHLSLVVSAPAFVQAARVLARPGMNPEKLAQVLSRQMPDGEKRRLADIIVPTGIGHRLSLRRIARLVKLAREEGRATCARSFSIPKPRASTPRRVIASSRSAASNS
jgi:dephospho-CoA kinase